jgi:hypothetical protein
VSVLHTTKQGNTTHLRQYPHKLDVLEKQTH